MRKANTGKYAMEEEPASGDGSRSFVHHGKDGYDFHYFLRLSGTAMPVASVSVSHAGSPVAIDSAGVSNVAEVESFFGRHADRW